MEEAINLATILGAIQSWLCHLLQLHPASMRPQATAPTSQHKDIEPYGYIQERATGYGVLSRQTGAIAILRYNSLTLWSEL
jgi:hypothetical protein